MSVSSPQPYLYTNARHPKFTRFPLHAATYNGREQKVCALLDRSEHCLYQTANDAHDEESSTALFVALARRHATIAEHLLDIYAADLAAIRRHFADVLPQRASSCFWLRERILVAFGREHVDFVRDAATRQVRADPDAMGPERSGLLVLLKPTNRTCAGVVWLSARQPGADRTIARIVGRIHERGGELSVSHMETFHCTLFDVAARMNLPTVWHRMHQLFGMHLTRRECVRCFRYLAEYEPTDDRKRERFDAMCRTIGGFESEELFAGEHDDWHCLYDAVIDYKDDHTVLAHLIGVAGKSRGPKTIIDQTVIDRGTERSLLSVAFQLYDKRLPWTLLEYRPDLISCCTQWWDTPARRFIHERPFDRRVHALIVEQFSSICRRESFRMDLLLSLIYNNWTETVREIFRIDSTMKELLLQDRANGISTLSIIAGDHHFEMLAFLLSQYDLEPAEKADIFSQIVEKLGDIEVPTDLWWPLLQHVEVPNQQYADLLEASLRGRSMSTFRRLLEVAPNVNMKDLFNLRNETLLFPAVFNSKYSKPSSDYVYVASPSPEIIDEEDDEESIARKTELNRLRTPDPISSKRIIDVNADLERQYLELFQELLDANVDLHHVSSLGRNLAHVAVERNNLVVLKMVVDMGIDASLPDAHGDRPVHLLKSKEAFALLPATDVRCLNADGDNALMVYLKNHSYRDHDVELMEQLVAAGLDVCQKSSNGDTALHLVEDSRLTELLLDAGADVNAQNEEGETPSHYAFTHRDPDAIVRLQMLFAHPEHDVFRCTEAGVSLLSHLVRQSERDFAVLRPLIGEEKLANLIAAHCSNPTEEGHSILALTQQDNENLHCLQALLEATDLDAEPGSYTQPSCADDEGRWLIECDAHISQRSDKRPLDWSAYCSSETDRIGSYVAQLDVFVAAGSNLEMTNMIGETALQWYCWMGDNGGDRTRVLARLLQAGANYRLLTSDGVPALEQTVFRSLYEWDEEKDERILQQVFKRMYDI